MKALFCSLTIIISLLSNSQEIAPKPLRHFMQSGPSPANEIQYGNNPGAGHYINAGDARIYYEVYGKGQLILVIHGGLFGSAIEMAGFIHKLKETNQVISMSLRGHGKSEIGSKPLTLEQRANDALAVINAVTKDSVLVLGFSDGGYTAYTLAAMYPVKVKKMIVIGAGELYPGLREFPDMKKARDLDKAYWEQQLKLMPEPDRLDEVFDQVVNCYSRLTVGKVLLGAIKCPVLVMAGDRDQGNSVEHVVAAARMIQIHEISIIPNASHTVFLENFPAVWESILPFLKQ